MASTKNQRVVGVSDDFLKDVMEKWEYSTEYNNNNERMLSDLLFYNGDQWPEDIKRIRESDSGGRPCLVINKLPAFERQVINDIRQMRPAIKIRPAENATTGDTANVMNGIIKTIELSSNAEAAYDWAAMYACRIGRGYWKLITDYKDNKSFDQIIKIVRVRNPFDISIDPDHREHDGSDMMWAFEAFRMPRDEFENRWPDAVGEWPEEKVGQTKDYWYQEDTIRVAQYYEINETERYISMVIDPITGASYIANGQIDGAIQTRKVKDRSVKMYTLTPKEVLEEDHIPGLYIPIVPVTGEEVDIEGRVYYKGMVRDMRDSQTEINMMRSTSVEQIALQPKSPWIGPKGSFKNPKWNTANRNNFSYLEYEIVSPNHTVQRQDPYPLQPALQEEIRIATEELREISGIYQASLGAKSNEIAGVAINARKLESDISNFHYMDNLARSMRYNGKILVGMIKELNQGPKQMEITEVDGTSKPVVINQPYIEQDTQKEQFYDIENGEFEVSVDTGPSYTTQRQEAADQMMDLLDKYPESRQLLGDLLVSNLDWPNGMAEEAAKRIKAMLPQEVLQGESPAISQMIQNMQAQHESEKQQLVQLNQYYEEQLKSLAQQLQDKQIDQQLKAQDQDRKAIEGQQKHEIEIEKIRQKGIEGQQDHAVDVSKLELEYQRNLTGGLTQ